MIVSFRTMNCSFKLLFFLKIKQSYRTGKWMESFVCSIFWNLSAKLSDILHLVNQMKIFYCQRDNVFQLYPQPLDEFFLFDLVMISNFAPINKPNETMKLTLLWVLCNQVSFNCTHIVLFIILLFVSWSKFYSYSRSYIFCICQNMLRWYMFDVKS